MSFTRRKFVLGMGTVIFFTGSASSLLANTRQEKEVRYAMIHDESRCNGCNICARACRKTNHVPAQGSRLSIAHIPVTDNDNETQYHFFRQSCQHCEDAPCIDVCPTGASWRDEQGIVRVEKSQCIGCSYCIGACPYQVRYLNPVTKVADKCDFCAESRLAKGFPPICVSACPEHALIFGREDYTLQQPEDIRGRVAFGALPWLMHDQPFVQGLTACAEIGEAMARAVVKPASRARRRLSFD